jgi:hypothetical protein
MKRGLMLLVLAAMLLPACADTNSNSRSRDAMIGRASLCATCGGSVSGDYFDSSVFKAIGPGSF